MAQLSELEIGASVVKAGVEDDLLGIDLGGWQGRITETDADENIVTIEWDSISLQKTPDAAIEECEEQGLSWAEYRLYPEDVEPTEPRDTPADVERVQAELNRKFAWSFLGPEGREVNEALAGVDPGDTWAAMQAWAAYLREQLTFPFDAKIVEFQERGSLRGGDHVRVFDINYVDDAYGILVDAKRDREYYTCMLADLEVLDAQSPNHDPVQAYRVWFANR